MPQFAAEDSLILSRNGGTGKYRISLQATLHTHIEQNDLLDWRVEFIGFPSGYDASDIQIRDFGYSIEYVMDAE